MKTMLLSCLLSLGLAGAALAEVGSAGRADITLELKAHRFTPAEITVPSDQTIRIRLINRDGALEEFDSDDLGVEEDVTPHGEASFTVGPLKPGRYRFMGELHAKTAYGVLIAAPAAAPSPP